MALSRNNEVARSTDKRSLKTETVFGFLKYEFSLFTHVCRKEGIESNLLDADNLESLVEFILIKTKENKAKKIVDFIKTEFGKDFTKKASKYFKVKNSTSLSGMKKKIHTSKIHKILLSLHQKLFQRFCINPALLNEFDKIHAKLI